MDRDEDVRRLLLDAVPDLRAPSDRLGRIAAKVRRRRLAREAIAGTACLLLIAGVVAALRPGGGPVTQQIPPLASSATKETTAPTPTDAPASTRPAPSKGASVPGVSFVAARIPAGWDGTGDLRVTTTGQLPGAGGVGAFRQVCQYSHMAAEDPVISPGARLASPLMVYAGNTGAGASSTAQTIANGGNSTCWGGIADRSAYWTTALIDTRTGTPLAPTEFSIRYSANYPRRDQVQTMPAGLKLVSDQATWGCWDGTLTTYTRPPACPSGAPLVLNIWFPRCWDGTHLDSPDHRSHVTYPPYPPGSPCPADHPVPIPQLEYHVLYQAPADSAWRLSNDTSGADGRSASSRAEGADVVGYAGFLEGWQPQIRQAWTDDCIRKAVTCESHMLGDGRVIDGKDDI
jgi:hypothetical protein